MNFIQKFVTALCAAALISFLYARTSLCAPDINLITQNNDTESSQQDSDSVSSSNFNNGIGSEASFPRHPYSPESIARSGIQLAAHLREHAAQSNQEISPQLEANIQAALICGGAAGVEQAAGYGDCWFESAVAALARLPKGQQLLSEMIVQNTSNSYTVNFARDGRLTVVNDEEIAEERAHDMGPWARILQAAAIKCYPELVQKKKPENIVWRGTIGLSILCGKEVKCIDLSKSSLQEVGEVLQNCLSSSQPMTAGTYTSQRLQKNGIRQIVVVPEHTYTVMDYDCNKGTITLRNPWGRNVSAKSRSYLPDLPDVGQESGGVRDIGGGLVQMSLPTLRQYYHYLAWTVL